MKDKIKLLLERGYFPVQLPPGFTTASFAKVHRQLDGPWTAASSGKQFPRLRSEPFSVARSSYNRRTTSILNPVGYFFLCKELAQRWPAIQNHFSRSRLSFSRPKLEAGLRAIRFHRFSDLHDHRLVRSAGYRYALVTDISRFFPTIYTHSIPWALHGKPAAKAHRQDKTAAFYGNLLDTRSRNIQDGQTIGLPIGPDSSHVIAEIIATAIDLALREALGGWPNGFRYVDDFYLFFNDRAEAERALAIVGRGIAHFELEVNASKTRIIDTKELIEESWKYKIKGANFAAAHIPQRGDIHKFFEDLIALEKAYRDESVVKYGLKIASSSIIKRQNWQVFEAYLLHCGFAYPNSLQTIASLLATYARYEYPLDKKAISRFCNVIVRTHAPNEHHSEVAWALWIMLELELTIDTKAVDALEQITSSACLLLAVALQKRTGGASITAAKLAGYAKHGSLFEDGWLLAYEGGRRGWLGAPSGAKIQADPFFSELLKHKVSFFDETARLPPIFTPKDPTGLEMAVFESDESVDKLFEFEDADEEYFDQQPEDSDVTPTTIDPALEFDDLTDVDDLLK